MNVLLIRTTKDGERVRTFTPYSSLDSALTNFYDGMRKAVADSNIIKAVSLVIADEGSVIKCERWTEEVKTESAPSEGVSA